MHATRLILAAVLLAVLGRLLGADRPDVIHLHGIDFPAYLPESGPPELVELLTKMW